MAVPPRAGLMRTASVENVSLAHPAPGLESLQGAYVKNVHRLEQSAEELSQGGSDIGEEIRRMKHEQDRASRRSSSMASREGRQQSISGVLSTRARNHSTSSYANSIVDVNTAARWGGYSPGGYVTSPTVSRVSSFHRPSGMPEPVQEGRPLDSPLTSPTSLHSPVRQPSHYSLAPTNEEMLDDEEDDFPENDADRTPEPEHQDWERASGHDEQSNYSNPDEQTHYSLHHQHSHYSNPDQQSLYSQHDQQNLYSQHDQQNHYSLPTEDYSHQGAAHTHDYNYQQNRQSDNDPYRPSTPPDRPQTADTYRQALHLFQDFDGVHYSPIDEETMQQQMLNHRMSQQRLAHQPRPVSYAQPPPKDNMVFYPAPVPRMLNLPKRLSQQPTASVQAKRRSEVLKTIPAQARQSAPWLPALDFQGEEQQPTSPEHDSDHPTSPHSLAAPSPQKQRRSMMDLKTSRMSTANLPPQLRASVFFDTEGPQTSTDVRIQSSSAVATLDSILAASVNAPVNVFVDHPFAGPVSREVYGPERPSKRRSVTLSKLDMVAPDLEQKPAHERAISTGTIEAKPLMTKRNSVMSILDMGKKDGKKLKKRNSKMSLMTDLDMNDAATEANRSRPASAHMTLANESTTDFAPQSQPHYQDDDDAAAEDDEDDDKIAIEDDPDMPMPFFAQPTTLLAELQTRKAHQKTRNRTAANAFPNGMHSTLLQLDAVAQVEKNKRQKQRTRLAWEDPGTAAPEHGEDEEDEDVPLGVLYPTKHGLVNKGRAKANMSDWDRPLGLMEKREFEDNEPLSSRRFRLKGVSPAEAAHIRQEQERLRREAGLPPPEAVPLPGEDEDKEDEDPNEPLAQRLRRLKQKEQLNAALGDVAKSDQAMSAFADDVMSTLGGLDIGKEKGASSTRAPIVELEEETLGQRRARLQREREAKLAGGSPHTGDTSDPPSLRTVRPPLKSSPSLANLLAAHPASQYAVSGVSAANAPAAGSLLAENAKAEEEARRKLRERNTNRSASYNHLVGGMPPPQLQTARSTNAIPQYVPQPTPQVPIMYPMAAGYANQGYLQPGYQGAMGGYGGGYGQQQMPIQQQQQAFAHFAQMQAGGNIQDLNMNPAQRDLIDRWRLSIMQ